jgi:hypothetical protein
MILSWAIYDADGTQHVIDEPVNGDSISVQFTRNMQTHGIISSVNTSGLEYYEDAFALLSDEFDTNGADGRMELAIGYECNGDFNELYRGKFDFNTFQRVCGDKCYITCDVINQRCSDIFLTRLDQDVDIDATVDMDGNAIPGIVSDTLTLDGQDILLSNRVENNQGADRSYNETISTTGTYSVYAAPYFPDFIRNEFGDFAINANPTTLILQGNGLTPIDWADPLDWQEYGQYLSIWDRTDDPLNCIDDDATIEFRIKGTFTFLAQFNGALTTNIVFFKYDINTRTYTVIDNNVFGTVNRAFVSGAPDVTAFDYTYSNTPAYSESEVLGVFFFTQFLATTAAPNVPYSISINYDSVSFFEMNLVSACDATTAKAYRLDRVFEWLNKPYVGDECFDVQVSDECLQNYHLTNGLHIRNVTNPNAPKLFLNWRELFDAIRKIFNYGWGFTNDETTLLVGDLNLFYTFNDIINLGSIREVTFTTAKELIYGIIDVGYSKWEAEEYNGLDEMNTTRQYRRNVQNSQNILDLVCNIITAGYTIEVTRRKNQARTGTQDWRYDNDLFIINTELIGDDYHAYRGVDYDAANIFSPTTRMNYRLTPARNLLTWFKTLCAARPTFTAEEIEFSSGTGNYLAKGGMNSQCDIEAVSIFENQGFDISDIASNQGDPYWHTLVATFDAPMSMAQYEDVKADPYGLVTFSCGATTYQGWIMSLEHQPKDGMASVKLLLAR